MGWLNDGLKNVGLQGGAALPWIDLLDKSVMATGKAGQQLLGSVAYVVVKAALAPSVTAIQLSGWNVQGVEKTVADLVGATLDTIFAGARLASQRPLLVADVAATFGGDTLKLARGNVNARLAAINVVPFTLKRLSRVSGQAPEKIAKAMATAPVEVMLASWLQAAHDVLEPVAKPIPKVIGKRLEPFFDRALLDSARYAVSSFGPTIAEAINGMSWAAGDPASAFTVQNVIVFSLHPDNSPDALVQWAYQLAQVEQYEQLGLDVFAEHYVCDLAGLRAQAQAKAERVARELAPT